MFSFRTLRISSVAIEKFDPPDIYGHRGKLIRGQELNF